jgi:acetylglutamate kinase
MKYVVKLGGAGLETPSLLSGSMRAITELVRDGNQVAVVHGGGVQLTRTLKALGLQSEFINGLRITDAETRDVALMVLAGKVNKGLVAALSRLGHPQSASPAATACSSARAKNALHPISAMLAKSSPAIPAGSKQFGS